MGNRLLLGLLTATVAVLLLLVAFLSGAMWGRNGSPTPTNRTEGNSEPKPDTYTRPPVTSETHSDHSGRAL